MDQIEIVDLAEMEEGVQKRNYMAQAAEILAECFPDCYGESAPEEIDKMLEEDKTALLAVVQGRVAGLSGAIAQYGRTGYELHPLAVRKEYRLSGIGTRLIGELEERVREAGGVMIYLGTDDEDGRTTLSQGNLFEDTWSKIESIRNLGGHPYEFYQKMGYRIVGVLPDANGIGKPDIYMAKSLVRRGKE